MSLLARLYVVGVILTLTNGYERLYSQEKDQVTVSRLQIIPDERWKDHSEEVELIRKDCQSIEDYFDDKISEIEYHSKWIRDYYRFNWLADQQLIPYGPFIRASDYLVVGDLGTPLKIDISLRNNSGRPTRIDSIRLVVDDFCPKSTARGSGIMELESLTLEPEREFVLAWPKGYYGKDKFFHRDRNDESKPLQSGLGYNISERNLSDPITFSNGESTDIKLEIETEPYDKLGFGSSHFLIHFEFLTPGSTISSKKITLVGSQWWLYPE